MITLYVKDITIQIDRIQTRDDSIYTKFNIFFKDKKKEEFVQADVYKWDPLIKNVRNNYAPEELEIVKANFPQDYITSIFFTMLEDNGFSEDDRFAIAKEVNEQFENTKKSIEHKEETNFALLIHPSTWFEEKENGEEKFNFVNCAEDIINSNGQLIITEYASDLVFVWVRNKWFYNASKYLKSLIRNNASIRKDQVEQVIDYIKDKTRITDPDKTRKSLAEIMPLPEHTIPLDNGLLNLTNGLIEPHNPKYFYTTYFPRHYIKNGISEKFRKFLDIVFKNDPEKEIKETQVYELVAWILTDKYNPQGMALLYGETGAGKNIITVNIIGSLLGNENYSSLSLKDLSDRFKPNKLYGALANITGEIGGFLNNEQFKKVTDFSPLTIEFKGVDPFKYQSRAKWIATTNEKPDISDPEDKKYESYYRRIAVEIEFKNVLMDSLTPEQIGIWVNELTDPHELDLIFSEVVDNYYLPFVKRGTFIGYKGIEGNKEKYIKDTKPILAYLKNRQSNGIIFTDLDDFKTYITGNKKAINMEFFIINSNNGELPITVEDIIEKDIIKWARENELSTSKITKKSIGTTLAYMGYDIDTIDKRIKGRKFKAWYPIIVFPINDTNKIFSDLTNTEKEKNNNLDNYTEDLQSLYDKKTEVVIGTDKNKQATDFTRDQSLNLTFYIAVNKNDEAIIYRGKGASKIGTDNSENLSNKDSKQSRSKSDVFSHEGTAISEKENNINNIKDKAIIILNKIKYKNKMNENFDKFSVIRTVPILINTMKFDYFCTEEEATQIIEYWIQNKMVEKIDQDQLIVREQDKESQDSEKINVKIMDDIGKVSDIDHDYELKKGDIASLSNDLANLLIKQGKAVKEVSQ